MNLTKHGCRGCQGACSQREYLVTKHNWWLRNSIFVVSSLFPTISLVQVTLITQAHAGARWRTELIFKNVLNLFLCTWKCRWGQDICQPHALVESTMTVHTSSLKFHSPWHGHHRRCFESYLSGRSFRVSWQGSPSPHWGPPRIGADIYRTSLGQSSAHMVVFF